MKVGDAWAALPCHTHKNRAKRAPHLHDLSIRRAEWAARNQHLVKYENSPKAKEQEELLEEYLERIQGIVNHMSSRLVVMYIPDVSQLHHPEMQHITQVLERLCLQRDIPFIDMTPVFEEAEDPAAFYLWPRDAHTNARGHRRMAEALYGSLCHLGILEGLDCGGTQRPVADVAFLN